MARYNSSSNGGSVAWEIAKKILIVLAVVIYFPVAVVLEVARNNHN